MTRDEAKNKVVDLLLGEKNPNGDFYASCFQNYNYGNPEYIPISPIYMGNVNKCHNVVITEEAYQDLVRIKQITEQTNKEVSFFLFGEEKNNGTLWFDNVVSTFEPSNFSSTDFSKINPSLNEFVNAIQSNGKNYQNKQVICHGHTHGNVNEATSDNFSFGDLIAYVEMTNLNSLFKKREIETMGMLLTPSGDFNFIMYENNPQHEGFYTFPTVYLRYDDGKGEILPSYTNGNYIVENSIIR